MRRGRVWLLMIGTFVVAIAAYVAVTAIVPEVAAGALLYPMRRPVRGQAPAGCADVVFALPQDVVLKGWRCRAVGARRGTAVLLHGVADNRESMTGVVGRFVSKGFDVIAYDSRAQGDSSGDACTYGYWEKRDLERILSAVDPGPTLLLGSSLGAAVAIQEAAGDPRIIGVVSAEVFSDLRTVARGRAPRFLTEGMIRRAFAIAEQRGNFQVDDVSPLEAARHLTIPVLLIHGADDTDTPPDHSRRVLAALGGPKELLLVPGARHNESLRSPETWQRIDHWVDEVTQRHLH
jgi:pimeloyl-ACP methyl ester carboxylesterase